MKWIPETSTLELTARNVSILLRKLDDPQSVRMIGSPGPLQVLVQAVEEHVTDTAAEAAAAEGVITVTREQLAALSTPSASVTVAGITVVSVPDEAHYADRDPGPMILPSTGEVL